MFKVFQCFNPVTQETRSWFIRVVERGHCYGRDGCLTHKHIDPLVEFYDASTPKTQFVSRYYLSTLLNAKDGIDLDGGVDAWKVDDLGPILAWLKEEKK